jgi:ATP-binding protein involved in chromosome partitioning
VSAGSAAPPAFEGLAGVKEIVAVHSAKGGVGKSTVAANLAVTFSRMGLKVGLLDADIHGPSIAHMFGSAEPPAMSPDKPMALPIERHGVAYLSLANVATDDAPIIWRGPMVSGALQQLLAQVDWGERDLLLIDMPPGTGDAILGVGQAVPLSGVVAVTTPQELSLSDTRRGLTAFSKLEVPLLGLVENMAGFVCDECGERALPFGEGGGKATAEALGIPFLGRLPLDPAIGIAGDAGRPAARDADTPAATAFDSLARSVLAEIARRGGGGTAFEVEWTRMPETLFRPDPEKPPKTTGESDRPAALWQAANDTLGILWGDGRKSFHGAYELRTSCPCAGCHEEWTGERLPTLDQVPKDVRPVRIRSVGRYAIQPTWTDGHQSGIFSFRDLARGVGAVDPR